MSPTPTNPAAWSDGDPLMEAIAAAVYEQAETTEGSLVVDDPRNIAAVAATVVRRVLGTPTTNTECPECGTTGACAGGPCPLRPAAPPAPAVDRATVLNERADFLESCLRNAADPEGDPRYWSAINDVARGLRQVAAEAQQPAPAETDLTEGPEDTIRRFARRLNAVERLCSGRPGYHTITVKALLTAMSDADEPAPAETEEPTP